jgi:hypothetical protein
MNPKSFPRTVRAYFSSVFIGKRFRPTAHRARDFQIAPKKLPRGDFTPGI